MKLFILKPYPRRSLCSLIIAAAFHTAYADTTAQSNDSGTELETVNISGKRKGNITEKQNSYTINTMSTATGMALSVKDTPQSVSA